MPEPEKRTFEAQTVMPLTLRPSRQPKHKADYRAANAEQPNLSEMSSQQRRKLVQRLIDFMKTEG